MHNEANRGVFSHIATAGALLLLAMLLSACKPSADEPNKPAKTLATQSEVDAGTETSTQVDADIALQALLLAALKPQADGSDRFLQADSVIKAYADAGYIHAEADTRMDYSDYHLLLKPAQLLGHQLMLIDNEYMQEYIGCCVSHGLSVTLKRSDNGEDLAAFATANACSLNLDSEEYFPARDAGLPSAPVGSYVNISCKERDVPLDD